MVDSIMVADSKYQYCPLNVTKPEIRLLTIHPQAANGDLTVTLEHTSFDDVNGAYDAVSYTWGSEATLHPICIDGRRLHIRHNIWRFLQHCSVAGFPTTRLWIDSICINQSDVLEKNHQVGRMGSIFSSAARVLIWLGEASELSSIGDAYDEWFKVTSDKGHSPLYTFMSRCRGETRNLVRQHCEAIITNEYWLRLWVVQEILVARSAVIISGTRTIDICETPYMEAILTEEAGDWLVQHCIQRIMPFVWKRLGTGTGRGSEWRWLSALVREYGKQLCHDPRDRIYALLGLARTKKSRSLRVDYNGSLETLFIETLQCFAEENLESSEYASSAWVDLPSVIHLANVLEITSRGLLDSTSEADTAVLQTLRDQTFSLPLFISIYVLSDGSSLNHQQATQHFSSSGHPVSRPNQTANSEVSMEFLFNNGVLLYCKLSDGDSVSGLLLEGTSGGTVQIHALARSNGTGEPSTSFCCTDDLNRCRWDTGKLPSDLKRRWEASINATCTSRQPLDLIVVSSGNTYETCPTMYLPCSAFELLQLVELNKPLYEHVWPDE